MARKYRGSEVPRPFNPATIKRMIEGRIPAGGSPLHVRYPDAVRLAKRLHRANLAPTILPPFARVQPRGSECAAAIHLHTSHSPAVCALARHVAWQPS